MPASAVAMLVPVGMVNVMALACPVTKIKPLATSAAVIVVVVEYVLGL